MFNLTSEGWVANRGTGGVITINPKEGQTFTSDDDIKINVYEKNGLENAPVLSKSAIISLDGKTATIELTNSDMELGEIIDKKSIYWYEIKRNGSTLVGWDESGAKVLTLYPEGSRD